MRLCTQVRWTIESHRCLLQGLGQYCALAVEQILILQCYG